MAPSRVALCVLGAVTLLSVASANPFVKKMKHQKGKAPPVDKIGPEDIKRMTKHVEDFLGRLRAPHAARRLQTQANYTNYTTGAGAYNGSNGSWGNWSNYTNYTGSGAPSPSSHPAQWPTTNVSTNVTVYYDPYTYEKTCDIGKAVRAESHDVQALVDQQLCMHGDDGGSWSIGFDGRSLVVRTFPGGNCDGPPSVTTIPCGCFAGMVLSGHLCESVPPPDAYITMDETEPGKCATEESKVMKMPIWAGCYHASPLSNMAIDYVKSISPPDTEVYALIRPTGDENSEARMVYSIHSDMHCRSQPFEVFSLSCECRNKPEYIGFDHDAFYLTGEYCKHVRPSDVQVFTYLPPSSLGEKPCSTPVGWGARLWSGVCHPTRCGEGCQDPTSVMAIFDTKDKIFRAIEYLGGSCDGPVKQKWVIGCNQCAEFMEEENGEMSYFKIVSRLCSTEHLGKCKQVPRSVIPDEIVDKLLPCMSM